MDRTHGVRPDDASTDTDPASGDGAAITVDHALGTTTIDGPVERVAALGLTDLDAALALGAPVVGAASSGWATVRRRGPTPPMGPPTSRSSR